MNTNTQHPFGVNATSDSRSDDQIHPRPAKNLRLSQRETEVLRFIGLGYSIKEIGHMLYLSAHTIISHRNSIKEKSKCRKATQLAVLAERMGLLTDLDF